MPEPLTVSMVRCDHAYQIRQELGTFLASYPKANIKELKVQLKGVKKIGAYCDLAGDYADNRRSTVGYFIFLGRKYGGIVIIKAIGCFLI
jgi:hypothetical protein